MTQQTKNNHKHNRWMPDGFGCVPKKAMRDLTGAQLKVYSVLCSYADINTGRCRPSQETLSADTVMTVQQIKRTLKVLRETGWVIRVSKGGSIMKRANEYRLTVPTSSITEGHLIDNDQVSLRDTLQSRSSITEGTPNRLYTTANASRKTEAASITTNEFPIGQLYGEEELDITNASTSKGALKVALDKKDSIDVVLASASVSQTLSNDKKDSIDVVLPAATNGQSLSAEVSNKVDAATAAMLAAIPTVSTTDAEPHRNGLTLDVLMGR